MSEPKYVKTSLPYANWLLLAGAVYGVNEPLLSYIRFSWYNNQTDEGYQLQVLWQMISDLAHTLSSGKVEIV